jgi:hypothetical protein
MGRFYSSAATASAATTGPLSASQKNQTTYGIGLLSNRGIRVCNGSYLRQSNFLWYKQTVAKVKQDAIAKPSYNSTAQNLECGGCCNCCGLPDDERGDSLLFAAGFFLSFCQDRSETGRSGCETAAPCQKRRRLESSGIFFCGCANHQFSSSH